MASRPVAPLTTSTKPHPLARGASERSSTVGSRRRLELIIEQERALAREAQTVLRVASSADILASAGRILGDSRGSQQTYNLSRPATIVPVFISHSWRAGRWRKALALAMHLHMWQAFACSTVCLLCSATYVLVTARTDACTVAPTTSSPRYLTSASDSDAQWSLWLSDAARASIVPALPGVVFALVTLYGSRLPGAATDCFLDKLCIHQTDALLK